MKLQLKLMCAVFLMMAVVFARCAGKPAKKTPEAPYTVGVIDSANVGTTYLYLLDEDLQETDTLRCPYHGVGSFGSTPVQIEDGVLYVQLAGNTMKPNKCAVAAMNLQTGEWKEYSFDGGIIEDFRVNEHGIFAFSNRAEPSIEYCPFEERENVSLKLEAESPGLCISVDGYVVYFISEETADTEGYDAKEEKYVLCRADIKDGSQEKLLDVTEELAGSTLGYAQWHGGEMYIPHGDKLCVYNPHKNEMRQIGLPGKEACQVLIDQGRVYVVDCEVNSSETDIYCFCPETGEIEAAYHIAENTLQSYLRDGTFYMLQQEPVAKVLKYQLTEDGSCRKLSEAIIEAETDDDHRISDMFVK